MYYTVISSLSAIYVCLQTLYTALARCSATVQVSIGIQARGLGAGWGLPPDSGKTSIFSGKS